MPIEVSWQQSGGSSERTVLSGPGPFRIGRSSSGNITLDHPQVSRHHVTITVDGSRITVADQGSQNGTLLAGRRITSATQWRDGEELQIGPFRLRYSQSAEQRRSPARKDETELAPGASGRKGDRPAATPPRRPAGPGGGGQAAPQERFPGKIFEQRIVRMRDLKETGKISEEITYCAIGGGIGSFIWVDHLRIYGVPAASIRTIGVAPDKKPYNKWGRLCRNSQIPDHERIRSNSISTPDNIWGFPGYASRECVREVLQGRLAGLKYLIQVFGEPTLTETYTPKIGGVFRSFDREARRIGWEDMYRLGQVVGIRKTDDERYAIAYRMLRTEHVPNESPEERGKRERFVIARYIQIATGYPASNYLPDLQAFKQGHPDSNAVVNAYEPHDEVYRTLETKGGTVLIRGRGIVASRVIQRIWEARQNNKNIRLLHLNRRPIPEGTRFDWAKRDARHNVELQPFNWPKSAWGGTMRKKLEAASPEERARLLFTWDGSHTADRGDWINIIEEGLRDGWYKQAFGSVASITEKNGRLVTRLENRERQESVELIADFIIDCTGLIAKLEEHPLITDLIKTYDLARNRAGDGGNENALAGLAVSNSFEIPGLQNGRGRAYASGVVAGRGPYAPVDSFLGLGYAALRSVDHLGALRAPGVSRFGPFRSSYQWAKWCAGSSP